MNSSTYIISHFFVYVFHSVLSTWTIVNSSLIHKWSNKIAKSGQSLGSHTYMLHKQGTLWRTRSTKIQDWKPASGDFPACWFFPCSWKSFTYSVFFSTLSTPFSTISVATCWEPLIYDDCVKKTSDRLGKLYIVSPFLCIFFVSRPLFSVVKVFRADEFSQFAILRIDTCWVFPFSQFSSFYYRAAIYFARNFFAF